jgi:hypothetical protein
MANLWCNLSWLVTWFSLFALSGAAAGCSGSENQGPTTYPVRGKVVLKSGVPLAGGTIHFHALGGSSLPTLGEIQTDGTFTLETIAEGRKFPGAVAGQHRATVILAGSDQSVPPIRLPSPVTVKPGQDNYFLFKIEKPK